MKQYFKSLSKYYADYICMDEDGTIKLWYGIYFERMVVRWTADPKCGENRKIYMKKLLHRGIYEEITYDEFLLETL